MITEQSMKDAGVGKFTFVVDKAANKYDIKRAVESLFNVNVTKVYTNTVKGSRVRMTKLGRQKSDLTYKKARVTLKEGQKIDVFEVDKK